MLLTESARAIFKELYEKGCSDREIAEKTFYSTDSIGNYRNSLGLQSNIKKRFNIRMDLYNQGLSDKEIAKRLNTLPNSISSWRLKNKLPVNKQASKFNKTYVHSEEEVNEIIDLAKNGMSLYAISKNTRASEAFVRRILRENNIMTENQKKYYARQANKE